MVVLNKNKTAVELNTARFHEIMAGHASARDVMNSNVLDVSRSLSVPARAALVLELQ